MGCCSFLQNVFSLKTFFLIVFLKNGKNNLYIVNTMVMICKITCECLLRLQICNSNLALFLALKKNLGIRQMVAVIKHPKIGSRQFQKNKYKVDELLCFGHLWPMTCQKHALQSPWQKCWGDLHKLQPN